MHLHKFRFCSFAEVFAAILGPVKEDARTPGRFRDGPTVPPSLALISSNGDPPADEPPRNGQEEWEFPAAHPAYDTHKRAFLCLQIKTAELIVHVG